ncbi:hypothetical protein FZ348_13345 [Salmonella enterica]|nr:hypothetical protein [Salmonella enterica]
MTRYTTTDVLICGAGVTGLTLAIELARHGVSFRLIEKRTTPFIGSRGKGIQPRTQEIFEDLGILNKVVAAGGLYPRLRTYRHDGSYVDSDIAHHTKPTHAEPYHLPLMVPQNVTETIMREQLKAWGHRVDVPFAIDLLDIDASLEHIYQSYGGNWPITFYPYYQQGIDEKIKSPTFTQLRQIIDPLRYLNTIYQPRLAIPKYIINASGDDFFVPDNTRFYYSKLPGVKSLRIVPNMNHYSINQFAEESLVPFINRFQSKKTLPQLIGLIHHHLLTVYFSEAPVKVVRWTANNPNARDFRYACGIRYQPLTIDIPANNKISITLNEPKTGWEATYIEATFNDGYVATSQVYITPDEKYPQTAPPSVNAACQTLPGRGLGENDIPD